MNWITKFIKPKIKSLFEKKSSKIEENLWTTCGCKNLIYKEDLESNQKVCPKCGAHHKLTCKERFETFFDNKEFELIETPLPKEDPLNFEDKKNIFFAENNKIDSWTRLIDSIINESDQELSRVVMESRNLIEEKYSLTKFNKEIENILLK